MSHVNNAMIPQNFRVALLNPIQSAIFLQHVKNNKATNVYRKKTQINKQPKIKTHII